MAQEVSPRPEQDKKGPVPEQRQRKERPANGRGRNLEFERCAHDVQRRASPTAARKAGKAQKR